MYPLGILFGLGFDTSSEIALLGIASIQAAKGTSIWLILIFPVLFTAGMALLDTADGALMMGLYTSTALAKDQVAILYYSIVLTGVTVVVAVVIGGIQMFSLVLNVAEPRGRFWDGVARAGDHYEIIGEPRFLGGLAASTDGLIRCFQAARYAGRSSCSAGSACCCISPGGGVLIGGGSGVGLWRGI